MPTFIVDLWLDGYDTEEEMEKACGETLQELCQAHQAENGGVEYEEYEEVE